MYKLIRFCLTWGVVILVGLFLLLSLNEWRERIEHLVEVAVNSVHLSPPLPADSTDAKGTPGQMQRSEKKTQPLSEDESAGEEQFEEPLTMTEIFRSDEIACNTGVPRQSGQRSERPPSQSAAPSAVANDSSDTSKVISIANVADLQLEIKVVGTTDTRTALLKIIERIGGLIVNNNGVFASNGRSMTSQQISDYVIDGKVIVFFFRRDSAEREGVVFRPSMVRRIIKSMNAQLEPDSTPYRCVVSLNSSGEIVDVEVFTFES